ncbi:hypothetical protein M9H77_07310 [Catharanthus roseus]|uniref:Uncharacterized protein n=1 Tax=Catharanthus roseus TaxID=4058 RepID=A0ACC0BUK9_CATRO|nr:hypothetical protein M9H77_07310 [Catharanthus roseus]
MENFHCKEVFSETMVTESKLLKHANEVYTIGACRLFEKQFMKFPNYCQELVGSSNFGDVGKVSKNDIVNYSAWRREMLRRFSDLISTSELNINARECIEEGFRMLKDKIAYEVGHYYVDDLDNEVGSSKIKDPVGRHAKGERNIRKKSIVEIKCNQARVVSDVICMTNVYVYICVPTFIVISADFYR